MVKRMRSPRVDQKGRRECLSGTTRDETQGMSKKAPDKEPDVATKSIESSEENTVVDGESYTTSSGLSGAIWGSPGDSDEQESDDSLFNFVLTYEDDSGSEEES